MFRFFIVAHQNGPTLGQPGKCALDHPAASRMLTRGFGDRRFPSSAQVRNIVASHWYAPAGGGVIPFIQRLVLRTVLTLAWSGHDHGIQRLLEQLIVIHIRRSHHNRQRPSGAIRQQALL
jgi:hypothetical protein